MRQKYFGHYECVPFYFVVLPTGGCCTKVAPASPCFRFFAAYSTQTLPPYLRTEKHVFLADGLLYASAKFFDSTTKATNISAAVFDGRLIVDAHCGMYPLAADNSVQYIVSTDDNKVFTFNYNHVTSVYNPAAFQNTYQFSTQPPESTFDLGVNGFPIRLIRSGADNYAVLFGTT